MTMNSAKFKLIIESDNVNIYQNYISFLVPSVYLSTIHILLLLAQTLNGICMQTIILECLTEIIQNLHKMLIARSLMIFVSVML